MRREERRGVPPSVRATRVRLGAVALGLAGVLFVLYPALRPFSDEVSLQGAQAFASSQWVVAHVLAIVAFMLTVLGLLGLYLLVQATAVDRLALWGLVASWVGVGLTLPFYGAEVFGLHVIGREALRQQNAAVLDLADQVRSGSGLALIVAGLLVLAVGAILVAVAIWRSRRLPKWGGVPFAVAFALYIPQYVAAQPIRVAHGLLLAVGCLWIAAGMWQQANAAGA